MPIGGSASAPTFEELWRDVSQRVPVQVQEPEELRVIHGLMKGMTSYAEIGCSNGMSAWVLGNALERGGKIYLVDLCEPHSVEMLKSYAERLKPKYDVELICGRCEDPDVFEKIPEVDVLLIDAKHNYESVKRDYEIYGAKAKKLLLFHDIRMEGPWRVFRETGGGLVVHVTRPSTMGYGVRFVED